MAGSTTTFSDISNASHKARLAEMTEVSKALHRAASKATALQARADAAVAIRDALGAHVRALFSDASSGFDTSAPATLTDILYTFNDTAGDDDYSGAEDVNVYLNEDVPTALASLADTGEVGEKRWGF